MTRSNHALPGGKLPLGKLPPELLARLLSIAPLFDQRILLGPAVGVDCAVIDLGNTLLAFKSDPITFASDEIGWYGVQICANDIVTTGAVPRWYLSTLLLPENKTDETLVFSINRQIYDACQKMGISVVGGHSEVTYGLDRPILMGTMIGEVSHQNLVRANGSQPGDLILLTKGVPIEATAILAREFPQRTQEILGSQGAREASDFLYNPGISVVREAQLAVKAGQVHAMHDPTEGGLIGALWEMAEASGKTFIIQPENVIIPPLSARLCAAFGLDPLRTIASGALLLTVPPTQTPSILAALKAEGIPCQAIGFVEEGEPMVYAESKNGRKVLPRPLRDDITRVFES